MVDRESGSHRPEDGGTASNRDADSDRHYPGTAVSCAPVIMKKVRAKPPGAKGTKRSTW
jgi:hypothetical protein